MNFKKSNLLIIIFIIIVIINIFIYINNKQKTSFRYFIWNAQGVNLGKIINISFVSGLLVSIGINNFLIKKDINKKGLGNLEEEDFENINKKGLGNLEEEDFENINKNNNKLEYEMPPERDIRDTQPTISVNYRVIKSSENNDPSYENSSDKNKYDDDWTETNYEW